MADNIKGIPFSTEDESVDYPRKAKFCVLQHHNTEMRDEEPLQYNEVYVIWFAYVLGNWKAILSTSRPDGRIYEVSYKRENDGSDGPERLFCDVYVKTHNTDMTDTILY